MRPFSLCSIVKCSSCSKTSHNSFYVFSLGERSESMHFNECSLIKIKLKRSVDLRITDPDPDHPKRNAPFNSQVVNPVEFELSP